GGGNGRHRVVSRGMRKTTFRCSNCCICDNPTDATLTPCGPASVVCPFSGSNGGNSHDGASRRHELVSTRDCAQRACDHSDSSHRPLVLWFGAPRRSDCECDPHPLGGADSHSSFFSSCTHRSVHAVAVRFWRKDLRVGLRSFLALVSGI